MVIPYPVWADRKTLWKPSNVVPFTLKATPPVELRLPIAAGEIVTLIGNCDLIDPTSSTPFGSLTAIRYTPEAPGVRHPVNCGGDVVELAFTGGGAEKTQPTGTWLVDVVVEEAEDVSELELEMDDDDDVTLLEAVELALLEVEERDEVA